MNPLDTYLSLRAAERGRAVPRASRRHLYISDRPIVIVGYHLAGDLGAPVALTWGTLPGRVNAETIVIPEPRNRDLRFEALEVFGDALHEYLRSFESTMPELDGRGSDLEELCVAAPQLVLANPATADWLYDIVGRFTRGLPATGPDPVPASVSRAGKHLSFFGTMRRQPGSCLTLIVTEALTLHYRTGQLDAEDLNLAALRGWIEPAPDQTGPEAARAGEQRPPAGPVSDPLWDIDHLQRYIAEWHAADSDAARAAVRERARVSACEQQLGTYGDCWWALHLLTCFPEAAHVAARWDRDRRSWTRHAMRMATGMARFRNIPTPLQAAESLRRCEEASAALEIEMALDDPAVMARSVASGEALAGTVVAVDSANHEMINGRQARRPLIDIEPLVDFNRPSGTTLFLANEPRVRAEVLGVAAGVMRLRVTKGALTRTTLGMLPAPGQQVIFSPHEADQFYPRVQLAQTPWTHVLPAVGENQ